MTNWMTLHDASRIQSTQALAGYDLSSRSFPARAQRAAARNAHNDREEENNGIQVNGGAIALGLLGVAAGLAWIHRDKLLDPEWRKEQQDNVKGFLEDGNQRLEVVHSQQTSNQLEGRRSVMNTV
ncbi:hypothetical protein TREMEDRAFT_64962 [Tremella mesenterica DSM 1558]|uniref:uncharacterized protein n=1 Tax=Tremella mesenterica (strain ATCC 24925 / CBS 8224 / DSM 1558 / NBRC 9311 / NRRL Y-6157 / RJB 2259-6 / UBC 559-6) TaxID=578456 RepID=UPI0003F498BF|nr:uncharacterized protein TREMEDRAFT_64962 [Tremella mesenterica DSM 1558]EIW67093.1 hypothetical protein TREMEDRAFT_64962 [Tremella mesenterica DSM 1558]